MPGHRTGSPFPAPFPSLDAVHARQQHQDRANPDDNKRKDQSNRYLTAHEAILSPEGINAGWRLYAAAPESGRFRNRGADEYPEPAQVRSGGEPATLLGHAVGMAVGYLPLAAFAAVDLGSSEDVTARLAVN